MAVTEARPLLLLFALTPPSAGLDQGDPLAGVLRPRGGVGVLDMIAAAVMAAPAAAPTHRSTEEALPWPPPSRAPSPG